MDPVVALIIGLVVGVVLGVIIGLLVGRSRRSAGSAEESPAVLEARHATALAEVRAGEAAQRADLAAQLASTTATITGLREQIEANQRQFAELSERVRDEQRERAEQAAAESKVLQALAPVKDSLESMQRKVNDLETQRTLQHGELTQQLRSATESEERLRNTAESLSAALRNNSTRGVWGETQLRSVVEAAGLINRVDFEEQTSVSSDAGRGRPDMIVHLPGGKSIAVDAKAPFNSYIDAAAIPPTASEPELARRDQLMKAHVKAVRDHISTLGSRAYWEGLDASPEMVIAFIPSESLVVVRARSRPVDHGVRVRKAGRARLAGHALVRAQDCRVQLAAGCRHAGGEAPVRPRAENSTDVSRPSPRTSTSSAAPLSAASRTTTPSSDPSSARCFRARASSTCSTSRRFSAPSRVSRRPRGKSRRPSFSSSLIPRRVRHSTRRPHSQGAHSQRSKRWSLSLVS